MKLMSKLMDWVSKSALSPKAKWILAFVAFTESIIVPLPPDLLLIPMALTQRKKAFYFATICTVGSVFGGMIGYYIGYHFMDYVGMPIVRFYNLSTEYVAIKEWYDTYNAWAVAVAGLTPIPYKLCTLSAGAFKVNFGIFLFASVISRSLRFFAIAGLIYIFGERARYFLEKRFDLVSMKCRGCETKDCLIACPYAAFFATCKGVAVAKCDLCKKRRAEDMLPACVEMCPCDAIKYVDRENIASLKTLASEEAFKRVMAHIRPKKFVD